MSSAYDLRAFAPADGGGPVKFPIGPYASAASYFDAYAEELSRAAKSIEPAGLERAAAILTEAYLRGARMFSCGNGGSASIANHMQCDHVKGIRTATDLSPHVLSLSTNVELLTAIANDTGYENIFVYQLQSQSGPGDVLLAVSSSGRSANIVRALTWARDQGLRTIAVTGFDGGAARAVAEVSIHVDCTNYGIVEDLHQAIMHALAQYIRQSRMSADAISDDCVLNHGSVLRGSRAPGAPTHMKILVTGGAGFIGSHTCDRLLSLGHEVIVLDALTRPVHRNGRPAYLTPGTDFYQGDTRNRDLVTNLLRRVDAVYHFAAYQDYLPDFSRFSDVNVVSTALLYEIIVAERLDLARVVVASSQSAMGEGLYWCPVDGEQTPGMRPESALAAGQWDIPCPVCGGPMELRATPERVSNPQNAYGMSKLAEEMVAINLGRRYGIPTVALRYSIVQGPRQSVYNAYSGACRIFCLSYLLGKAPVLYEDGGAIRDYVNIEDVVDANVLVLWDDRAAGRVFNVGGGQAVTTREFADIVMRQYGSDQPGVVTGEYRFGDTRHILSDISALRALGWEPRRAPGQSVAAYAAWLEDMDGLDGVLAEADARMRALGVVRKVAT